MKHLNMVVASIRALGLPRDKYEIIIVGGYEHCGCVHIPFNDSLMARWWITRKKNMITTAATYENIVYMHDYFALSPGWLKAFEGLDFKVAMTQIRYRDGRRFRDWCIDAMCDDFGRERMLPYDIKHLSKIMYISGGFWVAKRSVMCEFPQDERRYANDGEDIAWSHQVRSKYDFTMAYHPDSYAVVLKDDKLCSFTEMGSSSLEYVKNLTEGQIHEIGQYTKDKANATCRRLGLPCDGC
jgi:hypothetical protein